MRPNELSEESFARYPPLARSIAVENLALIQQLPLIFAAVLLRELNGYDWRFPAERRTLEDQFAYLHTLSAANQADFLHPFSSIVLSPDLERIDWVGRPQTFLDALTANLWSTHQIGDFREAANRYFAEWRKAIPEPPPPVPRLSIVFLGEDLSNAGNPLFRKLLPHGVFFPAVDPTDAWPTVLAVASTRAANHALDYGHWYVDGGSPDPAADSRLTRVSWTEVETIRQGVLARIRRVVNSGHGGAEEARTLISETTPQDLGLAAVSDEVLTRFQVSVLTEGSGTQIFSTTFVQWTGREALRRAQPCTLVVRYRPRIRQRPMNELIAGTGVNGSLDSEGSQIDADMGAYYTWINQQRLTGADRSSFVAWSEAHKQAIVIGPGMPKSTTSSSVPAMKQLLNYVL
jgi:hypothetical protein